MITALYRQADKLFEDGDWALMKGSLSSFTKVRDYFLHHTCTHISNNGERFWQTWFYPDNRGEKPWCPMCDSAPPRNLIGLFRAMTRL